MLSQNKLFYDCKLAFHSHDVKSIKCSRDILCTQVGTLKYLSILLLYSMSCLDFLCTSGSMNTLLLMLSIINYLLDFAFTLALLAILLGRNYYY